MSQLSPRAPLSSWERALSSLPLPPAFSLTPSLCLLPYAQGPLTALLLPSGDLDTDGQSDQVSLSPVGMLLASEQHFGATSGTDIEMSLILPLVVMEGFPEIA